MVRARPRQFSRGALERVLGGGLADRRSLDRLAHAGLALADQPVADHFIVVPCDLRLATVINRSRLGSGRKGWAIRSLIEAAAPGRKVGRVSQESRIQAAETLEGIGLDASELCDGRRFARIKSPWRLAPSSTPMAIASLK